MERHSFAMELKEGKKNDYRRKLDEIWPELTAFLDQEKVHNFSIWNCDSLIFGYYETDENHEFSEEKKAQIQALTARIEDTFTWISTPGENMRLMYHNFGVVRENKELIRHRMFMTKLKPGCEEEYKARHDGLVAAREGKIDPWPGQQLQHLERRRLYFWLRRDRHHHGNRGDPGSPRSHRCLGNPPARHHGLDHQRLRLAHWRNPLCKRETGLV